MPATLRSLRIRNLALVEELDWELPGGFVAVTGETGSGKSIILGALKLILGERADKSLIRAGAEQCSVEAEFEVPEGAGLGAVDARLAELGIEGCAGGVLVLKRVFAASGGNRQFVNCCATTLAVLKSVAEPLVDLHGPHDHQSLLAAETQVELLDAHAGAEGLRAAYAAAYGRLRQIEAARDRLAGDEAALEREADLLRHQVGEIEGAGLAESDEEHLLARLRVATNARRLAELAGRALGLTGDGEESVVSRLGEVGRLCREIARIDPEGAAFPEAHERAAVEIAELERGLRGYLERIDLDPSEAARVEERVSLVEGLKRKYGRTVAEVLAFGEAARERLARISSRGDELERLGREAEEARRELAAAGEALAARRREASADLAAAVRAELAGLGFRRAAFEVVLHPLQEPGPLGTEAAEFLIGPNPGEPLKPLRAIASSGEISRFMLAMKSALAAQDRTPLMVFDEIDANVGGEIAHAVGEKMRALGARHQVLAITHLPQVAAAAGAQYVVSKVVEGGRTISSLAEVRGEARVGEVARMLGGRGESALAHARTLLGRGGGCAS